MSVKAQTNGWKLGDSPESLPPSTSADISKVFSDFGIHLSIGTIGSALFLIYYAAKGIRNKMAPNSPLAKFLANWINLEQKQPAPISMAPLTPIKPPLGPVADTTKTQ
jgi:hypothetical protein